MSDHPFAGRTRVEVLVDGHWRPGRLRSCDRADEGADDRAWSCLVTWEPLPGAPRTDRFPAAQVR